MVIAGIDYLKITEDKFLDTEPHFNAKFAFSIQTWTLCLIVNTYLIQTHVLVQTWITTRPMPQLKQPDSRFISNVDHRQTRVFISNVDPTQTRVSVQMRIPARPAFHLKCGSQLDPRHNSNESLRAQHFNNRTEPVRVVFLL